MKINSIVQSIPKGYQKNKRNLNNTNANYMANPVQIGGYKKGVKLSNTQKVSFGSVVLPVVIELLKEIGIVLGSMAVTLAVYMGIEEIKESLFPSEYSSGVDDKDKENEKNIITQKREEQIQSYMESMNISREKAEEYVDKFVSVAMIEPTKDGNEKGINAIMGYGIEKYELAMKVLTPVVAAQKTEDDEVRKRVPNGLILYGPGGSGKTYIMNHLAEHLQEFGTDVKEIVLDEEDHTKNASKIKLAFIEAEDNFRKTGKYTIIKFPEDIDGFFLDRNKDDEFLKEIRTFLYYADNCASKGAIWMATANNPKQIDKSVLRRATVKMPIGKMKDFQIGDMIKYSLTKYGKKNESNSFDYQKVVDYTRSLGVDFTPYEYEEFVQNIINSSNVSADGIIKEIDEHIADDLLTLDEETKAKFKKDEEYVNSINNKEE